MSRVLLLVVVVSLLVSLVNSACMWWPVSANVDPITKKTVPNTCKLANGTLKKLGEEWVDDVQCIRCKCGGGCCGFGVALPMTMILDGERCKQLRTGGCEDFKFVKVSDPTVDC